MTGPQSVTVYLGAGHMLVITHKWSRINLVHLQHDRKISIYAEVTRRDVWSILSSIRTLHNRDNLHQTNIPIGRPVKLTAL